MNSLTEAPVPRNLRVRASITIANKRMPLQMFLLVVGTLCAGGLAVIGGADLSRTVRVVGALIVLGLLIFELRVWGRSTRAAIGILLRHIRRPRQLRPGQLTIALPPEVHTAPAARRPRWQV